MTEFIMKLNTKFILRPISGQLISTNYSLTSQTFKQIPNCLDDTLNKTKIDKVCTQPWRIIACPSFPLVILWLLTRVKQNKNNELHCFAALQLNF